MNGRTFGYYACQEHSIREFVELLYKIANKGLKEKGTRNKDTLKIIHCFQSNVDVVPQKSNKDK